MNKNEIESLRAVKLFALLSDEELQLIAGRTAIREFRKNETILQEDATNNFMYGIVSGRVKVSRMSEDGKETIIALHPAGEFFGEVSLIDGKTSPARVIAEKNSKIMILSRENFYSLIYENRKFLDALLQVLCAELRESWDRINILSFNNAAERIRMFLSSLIPKYGETEGTEITLKVKLTHQDLGNMTGISRETVTRVIDKLQKDRELSIDENKLIHLKEKFFQRQDAK
jgi:CRP/FNR family transcriptional regulator, cyclic AMP receptor protein